MSKLLGFKRFKSKNGNDCCLIAISTPYGERDRARNCFGSGVAEVFMPELQINMLTTSDIGKELKLDYQINGNKAYLVNVALEK